MSEHVVEAWLRRENTRQLGGRISGGIRERERGRAAIGGECQYRR